MMVTTSGTASLTYTILPNGETVMSSPDPWYRMFQALADLYLSGEIDADTLWGEITGWIGSGPRLDYLKERYPAAYALEGRIALAMMEPSCICIANWDGPPCIRNCEPLDRRERLRELIGGA